jgi:hypothetical protein
LEDVALDCDAIKPQVNSEKGFEILNELRFQEITRTRWWFLSVEPSAWVQIPVPALQFLLKANGKVKKGVSVDAFVYGIQRISGVGELLVLFSALMVL